MLCDFTIKNAKFGREICIELKNYTVETKCGERCLITIYALCKRTLDQTFKPLLTKYQFFIELPQISHTHKNRISKSIIVTFIPTASTM